MPIFANERYSGENHVTAANRAQTNAGIIGGNFVFTNGKQLAITVSPVTGEVSVAEGAFAFSGHLGGITLSEGASYTPPPSDTSYVKNIVVIRYSRNASTNIETYSLAVISSEIQASESAAQALTLSLASDTITESTTVAEFPLWSFIATASSNTVPVQLFTLIPSMVELRDAIASNAYGLQQEKAQRKSETEALFTSVSNIKKGLVTLATGLNGTSYENTALKLADFVMFILKFSTGETMVLPAVPGSYKKYFYTVEDAGTLTSASKVTVVTKKITLANFTHVKIIPSSADIDEIYGIR